MSTIVIGDVHGDLKFLIDLVKIYPKQTNFVQLGDFGVGFPRINFDESLKYLDDNLHAMQSNMYVVRGNHDDPSYFEGQHMHRNLKFVPDYKVIRIEGRQVLFVGGGISLDRTQRTPGVSWWIGEKAKFNEEKLSKVEKVDVIVSHTAPHFCHPVRINDFVRTWISYDPSLGHEMPQERQIMTMVYDYLTKDKGLKIPKWFYGHFHQNRLIQVKYGTQFKLLNVCEIVKLDAKADKEIKPETTGEEVV